MSTEIKQISVENGLQIGRLVGGWKPYTTTIDETSMDVFDRIIGELIGVHYTPLAVAKQLVAGMNYSFFCNAQVVGSEYTEPVMILVYVNLQGEMSEPSITRIHR